MAINRALLLKETSSCYCCRLEILFCFENLRSRSSVTSSSVAKWFTGMPWALEWRSKRIAWIAGTPSSTSKQYRQHTFRCPLYWTLHIDCYRVNAITFHADWVCERCAGHQHQHLGTVFWRTIGALYVSATKYSTTVRFE